MRERDASNPDELRLEMEGLRAENRRLRSLLGLEVPERPTVALPPTPDWEPTLFPESEASPGRAPVDNRSSPEDKVGLFRSLFAGRNCLVLSQWTEHIGRLRAVLEDLGIEADVLQGGIGKKARREITDRLAAVRSGQGVVLLATGSFLGEGFDCPPLDTLIFARMHSKRLAAYASLGFVSAGRRSASS